MSAISSDREMLQWRIITHSQTFLMEHPQKNWKNHVDCFPVPCATSFKTQAIKIKISVPGLQHSQYWKTLNAFSFIYYFVCLIAYTTQCLIMCIITLLSFTLMRHARVTSTCCCCCVRCLNPEVATCDKVTGSYKRLQKSTTVTLIVKMFAI